MRMNIVWSGFLTLGLLLAAALPASAQSTYKLGWDQAEVPSVANTFQYTLKIDNGSPAALTQTCVVKGAGSTCTAPLPTITPGTHTLTLTATNAFGSASSVPYNGVPPSVPINVTVTVTVVVGQ